MMTKDLDHILKKRTNIVSTMHTLWMQPNQIQNVFSVMKMKTIYKQMDLKAPKLYNTCMSKIHSYCIQCLFPGAYQENGKYSNTKEILFANISLKKKKIQSKSMYWSAMSTEVMPKINSYCRNIKIDTLRNKLNYQHFQRM